MRKHQTVCKYVCIVFKFFISYSAEYCKSALKVHFRFLTYYYVVMKNKNNTVSSSSFCTFLGELRLFSVLENVVKTKNKPRYI